MASALAVVAFALAGCTESVSEGEEGVNSQVTLQEVKGTDLERVTLTDQAVERLDIQTTQIQDDPLRGKVVPYSAVVYDAKGDTWVFVNTSGNTFVRKRITVTDIVGEDALLSAGPDAGTEVVTVGTAELYGAEIEISE